MRKVYLMAIAGCGGALLTVSGASAATAPAQSVIAQPAAPGTALNKLTAAAQGAQSGGQAVDPGLEAAQPRVRRRSRFFGWPFAALAGLFGVGAIIIASNDNGPASP